MAAFTSLLLGASLAATAVGGVVQAQGAKKQADAQNQVVAAQQRQEQVRENQMRSEAERRRRELIRQAMRARASSLAVSTAQGTTEGSVLPGAYGNAAGGFGINTTAINSNEMAGGQIFGENVNIATAQRSAASGATMSGIGGSIMSLGGALQQLTPTISNIGGSWFSGGNGTVGNTTGATYGI